jgi:hypothetical protein
VKLHPLLTKGENLHYVNKDGKNHIYDLEKELTRDEMIGFCKANIFKYKVRDKGEVHSDLKKITKYKEYLVELNKIPNRLRESTIRRAWKKLGIEWGYIC